MGLRRAGTFDRLRTLFVAVGASAVSSAVAAASQRPASRLVAAPPTRLSMTLHWGRNSFGLLIVRDHRAPRRARPSRDGRRRCLAAFRARSGELGALVVVSVAVYVGVFGQRDLPLAFLPLLVTLWAGLRFSSSSSRCTG